MSYEEREEMAKQIAQAVATQIEFVVQPAEVTVINSNTIQIVKDGIVSSVRVREAKNDNAGHRITHNGRGSHYEDTYSRQVGTIIDGVIDVNHAKMKKIASVNTDWDNANISDAIAHNMNYSKGAIKDHPSIHYTRAHSVNGIGVSVEIDVPNTDEWEKKKKSNSTKYPVPSGKTVMKIISETPEVDFKTEDRNGISIIGTPEVVMKVINRIIGNPLTDW